MSSQSQDITRKSSFSDSGEGVRTRSMAAYPPPYAPSCTTSAVPSVSSPLMTTASLLPIAHPPFSLPPPVSAPPAFNFAAEFESFLLDPAKQELLQRVLCSPMLREIAELKEQVQQRNSRIIHLENRVAELEGQNDALEQYTRRNSIRVSGIPEEDGECCETKVLDTFKAMNVSPPITPDHIDRLHRVGKPNLASGKPRQIIVKFTSYRYRSKVMAQRSQLKNTGKYVNEDLTRKRAKVLFNARADKREGKIRDCWTNDGRILVRDLGGRIHHIPTLEELFKLTSSSGSSNRPNADSPTQS